MAQQFEKGLEIYARRAREMPKGQLQQKILDADEREEITLNMTKEAFENNRVVELLSLAIWEGFAVQEIEDENLVEVVTRLEEEEVTRVFVDKKGNKIKFSTLSKRVTTAKVKEQAEKLKQIQE